MSIGPLVRTPLLGRARMQLPSPELMELAPASVARAVQEVRATAAAGGDVVAEAVTAVAAAVKECERKVSANGAVASISTQLSHLFRIRTPRGGNSGGKPAPGNGLQDRAAIWGTDLLTTPIPPVRARSRNRAKEESG